MRRPRISAFILTKNSERQLRDALESVKWADEIIINDGYSTDKTLQICRDFGCKVYSKKFEGFDKERNFAISKCTGDWIFEIDSDEVLDEELQKSIRETVRNPTRDVYRMKRKDYWLDRYLITITIVRLYRRGKVQYEGCTHEIPVFEGKTGLLTGFCTHNAQEDSHEIYGWVRQLEREIEKELIKRFPPNGKESTSRASLLFRMAWEPVKWFFGILLYKGLIFNGITAWMWAVNGTYYKFLIYARKYEELYLKKR